MATKNADDKKIKCRRRGCFAYVHGKCDILTDTDFKGRSCPFYKTREEYEKGMSVKSYG